MMKRCRRCRILPQSAEASSSDQNIDDNHLLPELLFLILARLPLKALVRFRCVCKSWCSLVDDDPEFAFMHLNMSPNNNPQPGRGDLLFVSRHENLINPNGQKQFSHFDLRTTDGLRKISSLSFSAKSQEERIHFESYVNGLALLYKEASEYDPVPEIKLWNPSIRKSFEVPLPPEFVVPCATQILSKGDQFLRLQLGYDPTTKEYKVVAFIHRVGMCICLRDIPAYARIFFKTCYDVLKDDTRVFYTPPTSVEVYTVSTGLWRTIWSVNGNDAYGKDARFWWWLSHPQFLSGVIYWIGRHNCGKGVISSRIVSFDVGCEVFRWTIKMPTYLSSDPMTTYTLGVMGKSLAFMESYERRVSIWLLDESPLSTSVEEYSWSKACMIDIQTDFLYHTPASLITKSEELLVFTSISSAISFDIKSQQVKNLYEGIVYDFFIIGSYLESLALLKRGKADKVTYQDLHAYEHVEDGSEIEGRGSRGKSNIVTMVEISIS